MISNNNGVNVIKNDVKSDKKINVDCLIKKNTVVTAINIDTAKNNSSPIFSPRRIIDIELYTSKNKFIGCKILKK
ncbi:hypothetical protein SEQ01_17320 [Streptococcus equinus]|nr:hypothetical protein SEQ01_17320 [Streptococcus equinus]